MKDATALALAKFPINDRLARHHITDFQWHIELHHSSPMLMVRKIQGKKQKPITYAIEFKTYLQLMNLTLRHPQEANLKDLKLHCQNIGTYTVIFTGQLNEVYNLYYPGKEYYHSVTVQNSLPYTNLLNQVNKLNLQIKNGEWTFPKCSL